MVMNPLVKLAEFSVYWNSLYIGWKYQIASKTSVTIFAIKYLCYTILFVTVILKSIIKPGHYHAEQ